MENPAVIDIETTDLAAVGAGIILGVCVRPLRTQRTRTFRVDQQGIEWDGKYGLYEREETSLLTNLKEELLKYDMLIGHNVKKFDLAYIRTRCFMRGIDFVYYPFYYDTMEGFRRTGFLTKQNGFGKPSASLGMVSDLFQRAIEKYLTRHDKKTPIYPYKWWLSVWGNELERISALNEIESHCRGDVILTSLVYPVLLRFDMTAKIKRAL